MANPTAVGEMDRAVSVVGGAVQATQFMDANGVVVLTTQGATIADTAAPTAYSAHASGATTVTSNAATDLDSTAAALATLVTEVTTLTTAHNTLLSRLEAHGILADA